MKPDEGQLPRPLRDRYAGQQRTLVWKPSPGRAVFRLEGPGAHLYLKLAPAGSQVTPAAEAARMQWARSYVDVPAVIECGADGGREWLLTSALPGRDATDAALQADPEALAGALGRGLRRFHERLPVNACPFDFRLDTALALVRQRASQGLVDRDADFHDEHRHLTVDEALARLERDRPSEEDLTVCHGDYCFPNLLLEGGEVTGYLDLGELGVADRWWDLAVATWSTTWNLGPGYESAFLDGYGIEPDARRTRYYRLLYDLVS